MTYSLHPEATSELEEALAFYREQGGIGLTVSEEWWLDREYG